MKNNTLDSKLLNAQVAIENALSNTTIQEALTLFGYDEAKLQAGKALYEAAQDAQNKQKQEYGDQFAASDELNAIMSTANLTYMRHVKVARIALRSQRGASEALQLTGRRKQSYSGWIKQASIFYTNALADDAVKAALTTFGINEQALIDGQLGVKNVEAKLAAQLREKGEAQAATTARDEALEALLDWTSDFIAIARIALEDQSQLLEMLGIVKAS